MAHQLRHIVGIPGHRVDLIGLVAVTVASQVHCDTPVVRREVLHLVAEGLVGPVDAVDEDDGRIAGAHLLVGDAYPVSGGEG